MTQGWIFLGGEVVYRDKDYFGVPAKGLMRRDDAARDQSRFHIGMGEDAERPDLKEARADREGIRVLKRVFKAGHVLMTTVSG